MLQLLLWQNIPANSERTLEPTVVGRVMVLKEAHALNLDTVNILPLMARGIN